jgi:hypothetical protein
MKLRLAVLFLAVNFLSQLRAQESCESLFFTDTLTNPVDHKVVEGLSAETTLKNLSVIRAVKTSDNRYFLRMIVTRNFYFDKVATLEIRSGKRSYYAKDTRQFKINKTTGLFVIEIYKNYLAQLKDDGITSIVFGEAETDFTRQDASNLRKMFKCFYEKSVAQK